MATAVLPPSSNSVSATCGSWASLQWQASGCAVNTTAQDAVTFTSAIPVGSIITEISGSVNAYTSGVALTVPGYIALTAGAGLGGSTMLASTTMTDTNAAYNYSATGLSITVGASTFTGGLVVDLINKENTYTSNHNIAIGDMTITYDPPATNSNNLFFGSTF